MSKIGQLALALQAAETMHTKSLQAAATSFELCRTLRVKLLMEFSEVSKGPVGQNIEHLVRDLCTRYPEYDKTDWAVTRILNSFRQELKAKCHLPGCTACKDSL